MSAEGKSDEISSELLRELDLLLFGSTPEPLDVSRWQGQGFNFSKSVSCGLTQLHGGPCGILAPVQAFVLKYLVFEQPIGDPFNPDPRQASAALIYALTSCLTQARSSQVVHVVLGESLTALRRHSCTTPDEVRSLLTANISNLESSIGVLLFVYSMLLTRGPKVVASDMDPLQDRELCLVGRFGHCSQDLVNLIITGRATTNVFDGTKVLGGVTLRGVESQPDVGFLSLLEALRYTQVGENYKNPKYPLWVVGSASHYTVLFGTRREIGQVSEEEKLIRTAKQAFTQVDPEEVGFIPTASLPQVLGQLGVFPPNMDQVNRATDPDSLGVCLWANFSKFVTTWHKEHKDWNCSACTFLNSAARTACEICNTTKPAVVATSSRPSTSSFDLYHFNGIEGHGKAVATLTKMTVTPQDLDGLAQGDQSQRQGLREVIRTRWRGALIVVDGADPKIS